MADQTLLSRVDSTNDLDRAVERSFSEPVVIFKHSATCPVSAWAREEMLLLARTDRKLVYEMVVQLARPLCQEVAERYGIRHESPQAIVLHQGVPVFNASHRRVTALAFRDALRPAGMDGVETISPLPV